MLELHIQLDINPHRYGKLHYTQLQDLAMRSEMTREYRSALNLKAGRAGDAAHGVWQVAIAIVHSVLLFDHCGSLEAQSCSPDSPREAKTMLGVSKHSLNF